MVTRFYLKQIPKSWYALARSSDLPPGKILTKKLAGQDLVLFRTFSGKICAMDAYCAHLGAHLGYGGSIQGELIQCPFHAFCFDIQGQCVRGATDKASCGKCKINTWHAQEVNGFVLVYYGGDHGEAPTWHVPALDNKDWSPIVGYQTFSLASHPLEIVENFFDKRHLSSLHGLNSVKIIRDFISMGPSSSIRYQANGSFAFAGFKPSSDADVAAECWGLGYHFSENTVKSYGIKFRIFFSAVPIEANHVQLSIAFSFYDKFTVQNPLLRWIPTLLFKKAIFMAVQKQAVHTVQEDFEIWEHKTFLTEPPLLRDEHPISEYREWARQFIS